MNGAIAFAVGLICGAVLYDELTVQRARAQLTDRNLERALEAWA